MAVVCALGNAVPEHFGGNFHYLAGGAYGPGDHTCDRSRCRRNGWNYFNCKRQRTFSLGLALGRGRARLILTNNVLTAGSFVLAAAARDRIRPVHHCGFSDSSLLRRRLWHHAGFCRGLFRRGECRLDLWPDAYGLGVCRGVRPPVDRACTAEQRKLLAGAVCDFDRCTGERHHSVDHEATQSRTGGSRKEAEGGLTEL